MFKKNNFAAKPFFAFITSLKTVFKMTEELYEKRIRSNYQVVVHKLNPDDVLDRLLQLGVITRKHMESLKREYSNKGCYPQNEMLMKILLKEDSRKCPLEKFVRALEESGQIELGGLIQHNISSNAFLSLLDKKKIQSHISDFVINMKASEVVRILKKEKHYFTSIELQDIEAKRTDREKADYLMFEVVLKGTYGHLSKLKKCLVKLQQHDLADILPIQMTRSSQKSSENTITAPEEVIIYGQIDCEQNIQEKRSEILTKLMDNSHDLHKRLKTLYDLDTIEAHASESNTNSFQIKVTPKMYTSKISRIHEDLQNTNLKKIIIQYAHFPEKPRVRLTLSLDHGEEKSFCLNHVVEQNEIHLQEVPLRNAAGPATSDSGYSSTLSDQPEVNFKKPLSSKNRSNNRNSPILRNNTAVNSVLITKIVLAVIHGKEYTPYDFWKILIKAKNAKVSPTDIKTDDGLNILQVCVDVGRLSFLPMLVIIGWWKILAKERVPENSGEYKSKAAKQIAEMKKSKKALMEFNMNNEWESSLSSLMKACRSGDISRAKQLIPLAGEDLFYCDNNGGNVLYWAVVNGNASLIDDLVTMGVDTSVRTKKKENLLHVAVNVGNYHLVGKLLSLRVDPWLPDQNNKTPLDRNAENGDVDTLQELIKHNVKPKQSSVALSAYMGRTPYLMYLFDSLKMSLNSLDIYERTPLHRSCEGSKVDIVKYLLEQKAELSCITCTGRNLLHILAENGNVGLMLLIMSRLKEQNLVKVMINSRDRYNGVELCFLIRGRDKGRDAWHYVEVKRTLVPTFLIKTKSGNVDVAYFGEVIHSGWGVNPDRDTTMDIEDMFKDRRLNKSAHLDMTPLHLAVFKDHAEIVDILLENGCDVNIKDCFGNTALMITASTGNIEIMRKLEEKGASFTDVNIFGKSAADIAEDNEHEKIINYIQGRDIYQHITTLRDHQLVTLEKNLSRTYLEEKRRNNTDIKRYLIDTMRDFSTDINQLLVSIGSSPVVEATDTDGPPTKWNTYTESTFY